MISNLPFTYSWLIKRNINKMGIKTILELGCGQGYFGNLLNNNSIYEITGVEIFDPYIKECKKGGKYLKVIKADITKKLSFKNKSFDAVVCLQTIEHIEKKAGVSLIKEMERIAKNLVLTSTPNGNCIQEEYDSNKYQRHLSAWTPYDFKKRGYRIFGTGLKWVYGIHSHIGDSMDITKLPLYFISFIMNPFAYIFPNIAAQLVAIKLKNESI